MKSRIDQGTFLGGGPEGIVTMHAAVDSDRLKAHRETRDVQLVVLHNQLATYEQADRVRAFNRKVVTIGSANGHWGDRHQGDMSSRLPLML